MPQLDVTIITPQIVWLVAIYFTFYLFLLKVVLPRVGRILKHRNRSHMKRAFKKADQEDLRLEEIIRQRTQELNRLEQELLVIQRTFVANLEALESAPPATSAAESDSALLKAQLSASAPLTPHA